MTQNKITYRQQYTRCGKQRCRKCRDGEGHGPYWYAYWSEKGRTLSKYIGVTLPAEVVAAREAVGEMAQEVAQPVSAVDSGPVLRVYLLGQFRVERRVKSEWRAVDSSVWQRRRARALLGCLLSTPTRRLGREQAMEQLWPDLDITVASNRLNGAVHELRQILEPDLARPANSRMLRLERDILELADNTLLWVDVETFENLLKEAEALDIQSTPEQVERILEKAEALYSGGYLLEELYSEWSAHRRDALQRRWVGLLLQLVELRTQRGAFVSAIETLDRLRVADPTNETALQGLMRLLTQLDRRGEALHMYRQHVAMMQREYESEPLPETRELYEFLRKGNVSAAQHSKLQTRQQQEVAPALSLSVSHLLEAGQDFTFTRPVFQPGRQNPSPLVGRSRERQAMYQLLYALERRSSPLSQSAAENLSEYTALSSTVKVGGKQPHFLLLMGDSGIGKTRLAEELSHEAYTHGWAVAWSRAYEQESVIAYSSWLEILRTLIQSVTLKNATKSAETLSTVTPQTGTSSIPLSLQLERLSMLLPEVSLYAPSTSSRLALFHEQERLYLWEAILGLLTTLSAKHPLLLVLDDVHWSDDSSIELLTYLAHHLQEERVLLVGTCRNGEGMQSQKLRALIDDLRREQAIMTLSVQPLTQSQIGALVSYLPKEVVENIQVQADGNPFFAEELARYVDTQAGADLAQKHVLPDAVTALLERRLHRLSQDCQVLLGKAAVLGGSFELRHLLAMASEYSEDTVLNLLDEVLQEGLVTEEGTGAHILYHFWHPLIVHHLYERLSAARRAQLHKRAAEAIKATSTIQARVAAAIFHHLRKGGSDVQDIAYYAELAGNQAYLLTAYSEAHYYYIQALFTLIDGSPVENVSVSVLIEHVTITLALRPPVIPHDLHTLCRLLELAAECSFILGNFEDTQALYETILALRTSSVFQEHLITSTDDVELRTKQEAQIQALLWREIVSTWKATGAYAKAHEGCHKGKEVLRQAGITSCAAWACLHLSISEIFRYEGSYQEARQFAHEALSMFEQFVPPLAIDYRTPRILISTEQQATKQRYMTTTHIQTKTEKAVGGDRTDLANAYEQLGVIEASVGHANEAQRSMLLALTEYEQQERISEVIRVCGNLGAVFIMKSENNEARIFLKRALKLAERSGDLPNIAFVTSNFGDLAYYSGDLLEAEAWYKRSLELAERINDREHISWCSVLLATVQQAQGYLHDAALNLRKAIRVGRAIKSSRCIRFALVGLGDLRIVEAIIACKLEPMASDVRDTSSAACQRLLRRATSTLQHAISQEGVEMEIIIECQLLLATAHLLRDDLTTARQIVLQTLQKAQAQETIRVTGRAQRLLGRILSEQKEYDEAEKYFEQACEIFRRQELRLDYARTLHGYGLSLVQRSVENNEHTTHERGMAYLHEARAIFNSTHATIDFSWVDLVISKYTPKFRESVV